MSIIANILYASFNYSFEPQKIKLRAKGDSEAKRYLVIDRKQLPLWYGLGYVIAALIGTAILVAITTAIVGGAINLLRVTFGGGFSWPVFWWWGGLASAFLWHHCPIQLGRWFLARRADVDRAWMMGGLTSMIASLFTREAPLPRWGEEEYQRNFAESRYDELKGRGLDHETAMEGSFGLVGVEPEDDWVIRNPQHGSVKPGEVIEDAEFTEIDSGANGKEIH